MGLMVGGLIVSAVVLLTMLGTKADSRKSKRPFETRRPVATSDVGN